MKHVIGMKNLHNMGTQESGLSPESNFWQKFKFEDVSGDKSWSMTKKTPSLVNEYKKVYENFRRINSEICKANINTWWSFQVNAPVRKLSYKPDKVNYI